MLWYENSHIKSLVRISAQFKCFSIRAAVNRNREITAMLKARKSLIPTENNVPAQSVTAMVSLS